MFTKRTVIVNVAFAWCTFVGLTIAQEKGESGMKLYWIFLTTGKSTDGVASDDVRKMQNAHLANFGRLSSEGKLLTAGPMHDSDGMLRGIVVVKASDRGAVDRMFEADPYVAAGYMKVEAHEARINHGRIVSKVTPESLEEFRIVIFSNPKNIESTKKRLDGQLDYVKELSDVRAILLSSEFVGKGSRRSVWIAEARDDLKRLVEVSPAVATGARDYRIVPLYLGKGSLVGDNASP